MLVTGEESTGVVVMVVVGDEETTGVDAVVVDAIVVDVVAMDGPKLAVSSVHAIKKTRPVAAKRNFHRRMQPPRLRH